MYVAGVSVTHKTLAGGEIGALGVLGNDRNP